MSQIKQYNQKYIYKFNVILIPNVVNSCAIHVNLTESYAIAPSSGQ